MKNIFFQTLVLSTSLIISSCSLNSDKRNQQSSNQTASNTKQITDTTKTQNQSYKDWDYVETSYNAQLSKEAEKLFKDSLGHLLTASVRVYDQIKDNPLKYVSVSLDLKVNYLEEDQIYEFEQIKSATISLLFTKFPEKTFIGIIYYFYKSNEGFQMKSIPVQ